MSKSFNHRDQPMLAEIVPPLLLPRALNRFDLLTLYFALIFGAYGAAQMSNQGWAGIPMLLIAAVTFLVPCALASYELGTRYPGEGGIYIWAHKTVGPVHGFIAGWLSWVPIFLLLPLGATTITAHLQFILGKEWPLLAQIFAQVAVILLVTMLSLARLRLSQAYINLMFFLAIGTAVVALIAGLLQSPPVTPVNSDLQTINIFKYGALYSAAILWLLGVEVPFNMGAEFKEHRRSSGFMFLWGSIILVAAYVAGIAGVVLTTPAGKVDPTTGVARAVNTLSPTLGVLVAIAIVLAVSSQDVAYMNTYSRLLFISGIERRLPSVFGSVSEKSRAPVAALLLQALGAVVVVAVFSSQTQLAVAFNLYLAALVTVWCASLFYLYIGILRGPRSHEESPDQVSAQQWRIPGGMAGRWFVALWGSLFNAIAIYYVFAFPWTGGITPFAWRAWLFGIAAVVTTFGLWLFVRSKHVVASLDKEREILRYQAAASGAAVSE